MTGPAGLRKAGGMCQCRAAQQGLPQGGLVRALCICRRLGRWALARDLAEDGTARGRVAFSGCGQTEEIPGRTLDRLRRVLGVRDRKDRDQSSAGARARTSCNSHLADGRCRSVRSCCDSSNTEPEALRQLVLAQELRKRGYLKK